MARKHIGITFDTILKNHLPIEGINEGDMVEFKIEITENRRVFDATDEIVTFYFKRADGTLFEQTEGVTWESLSKGKLKLKTNNKAFNKKGITEFQIKLTHVTGEETTSIRKIKVGESLVSNEAVENTNEVSALKKLEEFIEKGNLEFPKYEAKINEFEKKINGYDEKTFDKLKNYAGLVGMVSDLDTIINFDVFEKKITLNKPIVFLKERGLGTISRVVTINPFEYTLKNSEIIYLKINEVLENPDNPTIYKNVYWVDFDFKTCIPLFWYHSNNISTTLNLEIKKNSNNIAWFGDSISELKQLPHKVGVLNGDIVYDCSMAGSVLSYSTEEDYKNLGVRQLIEAVKTGDYTKQEKAAENIKLAGGSDKTTNLNNLKKIRWEEIQKVVIFAGTNDYGANTNMGNGNIEDETEFWGSIKFIIENLQTLYPHLQIYFITPIWRDNGGDSDETTNSVGLKLYDYCRKIIEVCKEYHIPALDLYSESGVNKFTKKILLQEDGLHQTEKGDNLLAKKISKFVKEG